MELKEFISQTLIQIIEGVTIAQKFAEGNDALISPRGYQKGIDFTWREKNVEFDVAITTTDATEAKTGAGIFVAGISLGAQARGEISNQTLSHIKFTIPIHLPAQKMQ